MALRKLTKFRQLGRVFFSKGIILGNIPIASLDSKSSEYYLLILQESRSRFTNLGSAFTGRSLASKIIGGFSLLFLLPLRYFRLKATTAIVESILLENALLKEIDEKRKNRGS